MNKPHRVDRIPEDFQYTKEQLINDLWYALRVVIVVSFLVALKYLDQNN